MKNQYNIGFILLLFVLGFLLGCEQQQGSTFPTGAQTPAYQGRKPAGTAVLKSGQSPVLSNLTFKAFLEGSNAGAYPSLLEYRGSATLEGTLSFKTVLSLTCGGGGIYSNYQNNRTSCSIAENVNYRFVCRNARIEGQHGGALFVCDQAQIQGSSYTIVGELRPGVSLEYNYTIWYAEICGGPGAPASCGSRVRVF